MGANSINMRRVQTRVHELFDGKIDMTDFPNDNSYHFETRTLAAIALMMRTGLELPQACNYITDGYNDMGIDAIYLDELQKKLFVVQSKWRNSGAGSVAQDEISAFAQGLQRILNEDLSGTNSKILSRAADIDSALTRMGYQIYSVFIHTGDQEANTYVLRPITELENRVNDELSELLLFEEINFNNIFTFLAKEQEQADINIDDVILSCWGRVDEPYTAYYGTVSAAAVGKWYADFGNRLFAKNIRFYKGNTEVNEGIKKVLLQEPEKFFYYNNGIKLLCQSIQRKIKDSTTNATGLFSLHGVSLVNGAQTTGTIGTVYSENPEQVKQAMVMIQIIDLSSIDSITATQITKLSNTQNRIENKDFAALDPEQERIRRELSFAHYDYLYKSGDTLLNPDKEISFDETIVALACMHDDISYAVTAKRNVGALSEDISKAPYKVLINSSTNTFAILNAVLYMREIERYLQRKKSAAEVNKERLICIHANRFIEHLILVKLKAEESFCTGVVDIKSVNGNIGSLVDSCLSLTMKFVEELFPDSYPANIFKNATKCGAIKSKIIGAVNN